VEETEAFLRANIGRDARDTKEISVPGATVQVSPLYNTDFQGVSPVSRRASARGGGGGGGGVGGGISEKGGSDLNTEVVELKKLIAETATLKSLIAQANSATGDVKIAAGTIKTASESLRDAAQLSIKSMKGAASTPSPSPSPSSGWGSRKSTSASKDNVDSNNSPGSGDGPNGKNKSDPAFHTKRIVSLELEEAIKSVSVSSKLQAGVLDTQEVKNAKLKLLQMTLTQIDVIDIEMEKIRADTLDSLGKTISKFSEKMDYFHQAYDLKSEIYNTDDHPSIAVTLSHIAAVLYSQGEKEKALEQYKQVLEIYLHIYGEMNMDVAIAMGHIAGCMDDVGQTHEALLMSERALAVFKAIHPEGHENIVNTDTVIQYLHTKLAGGI
jgi:tetratricopeptide (TPR) repeat protein